VDVNGGARGKGVLAMTPEDVEGGTGKEVAVCIEIDLGCTFASVGYGAVEWRWW